MRHGQNGGRFGRYDAAMRARLSPFVSDEADAYESDFEQDAEASTEDESVPATPVRARILWPALGFPAVIAPRARPSDVADATRCVCVLLMSNRKALSKAEAARYLRCVPWAQRTRRHIAPGQPGSFAEEELSVKNDSSGGAQALVIPGATDRHSTMISFGADHDGNNGVVVDLANSVRTFYERQQLRYLHEIRIYEHASARLQNGRYHLFWNNETAREGVASDEMTLLLQQFAPGRREKLGALWKSDRTRLLEEYEYEYGNAHLPYARPNAKASAGPRTELLHPLFVRRDLPASLKIGQLTDIHVDVRADVYEENLRHANLAKFKRWTSASYNNWNRNFTTAYAAAREQSDVLLLTGDLVDYGRGHWGPDKRGTLGQDGMYHVDRNWFLFHYLLASGDRYTKPVYTILGNHDWRVNPYPPFAIAGTPAPKVFVNNHADFSGDELKQILQIAHGPGYDPSIAYNLGARGILSVVKLGLKALAKIVLSRQTMDERGTPVETTVQSIEWYLHVINPFLDYAFKLPSEHRVLMLDWAEDENVLFPVVDQGVAYPLIGYAFRKKDREKWSDPGPKAKRSLTDLQKRMLEHFASAAGKAKVIGIHAPPVGPYPDWTDTDLYRSRKTYRSKAESRGPMNYATKNPDGTIEKWNGHPLFALQPRDADAGVAADYGSFERARDVFLQRVTADAAGIRLVFSGHIHRACLLTINVPTTGGKLVEGHMRLYGLTEQLVRGAKPPRVSPAPQGAHGPLFVVGTSLGPIGHYYPTDGPDVTAAPGYIVVELANDGTIRRVDFKPPMPRVLPVAAPKPATTHEMSAPAGW